MSIGTNDFIKKGRGRIYVMDPDPEKIERVLQVIRSVDESEFASYFPKDLVAPFAGEVELVYTGKFETCMDTITLRCWRVGIAVWCISQRDRCFGVDPGAFRHGKTFHHCSNCPKTQDDGSTHVMVMEGVGWVCQKCGHDEHWSNHQIQKREPK